MRSHLDRVANARMPDVGSAEVCGTHHGTQYIKLGDHHEAVEAQSQLNQMSSL